MTESQKISWKRIGIEASAIVSSILLAFAIDAWWGERLERIDEREQLDRLQAEFLVNIERIDVREFEKGILEACVDIFELIEEGQSRGDDEIIIPGITIGKMLTAPTFDADTPILNGLIRSGRLEIIQDEQVLALISIWERTIYDYTTFAERARRSVDQRLIPAFVVRGDIGSVLMTLPTEFSQFGSDQLGDITMRIDNELKGLVAERWRNGRFAVTRLDDAQTTAEDIVEAIKSAE